MAIAIEWNPAHLPSVFGAAIKKHLVLVADPEAELTYDPTGTSTSDTAWSVWRTRFDDPEDPQYVEAVPEGEAEYNCSFPWVCFAVNADSAHVSFDQDGDAEAFKQWMLNEYWDLEDDPAFALWVNLITFDPKLPEPSYRNAFWPTIEAGILTGREIVLSAANAAASRAAKYAEPNILLQLWATTFTWTGGGDPTKDKINSTTINGSAAYTGTTPQMNSITGVLAHYKAALTAAGITGAQVTAYAISSAGDAAFLAGNGTITYIIVVSGGSVKITSMVSSVKLSDVDANRTFTNQNITPTTTPPIA